MASLEGRWSRNRLTWSNVPAGQPRRTASQPVIVSADLVMCSAPGMSAEAKAVLGQAVFDDPKGFGAHAMQLGQFRARDTRELT